MLKFDDLQPGERVSLTQYFEVQSIDKSKEQLVVKNRNGQLVTITGKNMIESGFYSNIQYKSQAKVGKTVIAEKLQNAGDKIFKVRFTKADGEERTLTGYVVSSEPNLGRTKVIDLSVDPQDGSGGFRLIDNRTIIDLVVDGVLYYV